MRYGYRGAPVTVEDYKVLPETGPRYQLVKGSLSMAPAPTRYHQDISRNIEFIILTWIKAGAEGAPDLVVEILSPSTRKLDLGPKKDVYARRGVKELWVVDPDTKTVEQFLHGRDVDSPIQIHRETDEFTSEQLPGLTIDCPEVFAA